MNATSRQPGTMIVVVGPSGAGKDSLIDGARALLAHEADIAFVRRAITRAADAGGESHEALTEDEFESRRRGGGFAVDWRAHGLGYGIPATTIRRMETGTTLVCNGSRAALPRFETAYPRLEVIAVVARPEVIAQRLAARGRESADEIALRLSRSVPEWTLDLDHMTIDNSGSLSDACRQFVAHILRIKSGDRRTSAA